jgi:hypothetical protein
VHTIIVLPNPDEKGAPWSKKNQIVMSVGLGEGYLGWPICATAFREYALEAVLDLAEDQISPLAQAAAHHALNELTVKVSLLVMDGSKMINMQEKKLNANFTTVHLADAVQRGRGQVYVSIRGLD